MVLCKYSEDGPLVLSMLYSLVKRNILINRLDDAPTIQCGETESLTLGMLLSYVLTKYKWCSLLHVLKASACGKLEEAHKAKR